HANEPEAATDKSKDLVRMGIAKARHIQPLAEQTVPVTPAGIIIGGGVAGMTAALNIASQGFHCVLVEKTDSLGGNLKNMTKTLAGEDTQKLLKDLTTQIKKNKKIDVLTNAELATTSGFVGNFSSVIAVKKGRKKTEQTIDHGIIVVATGGKEHRPDRYLLGKSKKVVTQQDLELQLAGKAKKRAPDSVVMIQCAGSRGDDLAYCSKTCCNNAVKNALTIKAINPDSQVIVLYRDIRTYGYAEDAYLLARKKGVLFVPYEMDNKPEVTAKGAKVNVSYYDPILGDDVTISPHIVALSVGTVPEETATLSKLLKVPVNENKFYLEAHVKLRPVEMPVDGVYVCGLAHSPKPVDEIIVQAQAAAAKASIP
ncbi:MAG: CoB--CoM heterodisulfide reductase iron-sulfur subunit A family protein, partial [Desulfobulbaceae bacterium]|nr:CoB--CoM heterodisulfide reductase iron-sulfur subunit A family protein [Desulfobulbaceae bacterium]